MILGYWAHILSGQPVPDTSGMIRISLLILAAATGARTVGFALNRIIDRQIDARNPRTATRDLPSGKMTLKQAYGVLLAGLVVYLIAASQINLLCLALSPIPILVFAIYPYLKRFTVFAHFGVGLSLALGPVGGYFAIHPSIDWSIIPIIWLFLFTWCWVAGFDIIYSTYDESFDKSEGLFSFPSRFGKKKALQYSGFIHIIAFLLLAGVYVSAFAGSFIVGILLLASGYLLYLEQAKAEDVELAFFKINAVLGFVVFTFVLIGVELQLP